MGFHIPCRIDSASFPRSGFRQGRKTQAEVFDTGRGPFRALIVSNLKWGGPCRATTCFRQADIKIFRNILKSPDGISYFPYMVALSGRDKVRPRT